MFDFLPFFTRKMSTPVVVKLRPLGYSNEQVLLSRETAYKYFNHHSVRLDLTSANQRQA